MQPLWQRVIQQPDDVEARRVLADALLEHADPRGELIAVQCRLAEVPDDERGPEEHQLAERERELLDAHGEAWTRPWPFELLPVFVRGFPERQHARASVFVRHAERAFRVAPTLRELVFTDEDPRDWSGGFNAFCVSPHASRLTALTLPVTFQPGDSNALATLAATRLAFTGGVLGDLEVLSRLPLQELRFEFDVGVRGLEPLSDLPLRAFVDRGNDVPLVPAWPGLERLTLDRVSTRVDPSRWQRLERLELFDTQLGRRGLRALLSAGHPAVRRLGLRGERLEPELVPLLERWPRLEVLDLGGCAVGASARRALDDSPVVTRLRRRFGA